MLVCNYCGRNFKNDYNTCPGCGATTFKRISDLSILDNPEPTASLLTFSPE